MGKNITKKRKVQQDKDYDEAQSLFITGLDLEKISGKLSVPPETLKNWQSMGQWEKKKEFVAEHPKLMVAALKGLVKQKLESLLAGKDEININSIDELNKIIALIERLDEQSWDERAAIIEVMSLFGNFVRRQVGEKQELHFLTKLMEKFFVEMEGS